MADKDLLEEMRTLVKPYIDNKQCTLVKGDFLGDIIVCGNPAVKKIGARCHNGCLDEGEMNMICEEHIEVHRRLVNTNPTCLGCGRQLEWFPEQEI